MGLCLFLHQLQVLFATFPKKAFEKKEKYEHYRTFDKIYKKMIFFIKVNIKNEFQGKVANKACN